MAAYAALVTLQCDLKQILGHRDPDFVIVDGEHEIQSLQKNVVSLVTFLDDFPEDAGAVLEGRIRNVVNQAQDVIEGWVSDELHSDDGVSDGHKVHWKELLLCGVSDKMRPDNGGRGFMYRIWQATLSVLSSHHQVDGGTDRDKRRTWRQLFKKLQGVMKELETIAEEAMQIKGSSGTKDQILCDFSPSSSGVAPSGEGTAVGLEQDSLEIKGRLCGEPSKLQIIPIIGMGGIGKTTLAGYVYNDSLITYHFHVRAWVTVSQDYSIEKILFTILNCMNPTNKEQNKEKLREYLYKFLKGRRYLLVLDDVWNASLWDDLRRTFPDDSNGSRIIITSRHLDVASYVDPKIHPHKMNLMGKSQSWDLLREKVFVQKDCPPELEQIGKFIAEKCGGLPLAIVVIAGILSKKKLMQETWKHIALNVNEAVNSGDEIFNKILSLSYAYLPHYLRPYFLYIGGFPEDYEIKVSKVAKFWVAEGFLKSNRSKYDLEEVVEEYLEELIERNLVLVIRKSNGKTKTIKIHDVLRDLCLRKAWDDKFLEVVNDQRFRVDHRIFGWEKFFSRLLNNFQGSGNSSIQITLFPFLGGISFASGKSFKRLKILDALGFKCNYFPSEIGELLQLRYLAITFENVKGQFEVPSYLSKLRNLQTLIIMPYYLYPDISTFLPFEVWRLPQLRHLVLFNICFPSPRAETFTTLENLCTLSRVINFTCHESILKLIPHVKKLEVFYEFYHLFGSWSQHDFGRWSQYELKNLVYFRRLEKLNLEVENKHVDFRNQTKRHVLRDIAFPMALKKLTLRNCRFPWEDMTIIGSLPNLEVLKLKENGSYGFRWKTTEGEFLALKVLVIQNSDPCHWMTESSHFPNLRSLLLVGCQCLLEIPDSIGEISSLQLIGLQDCRRSIKESAKRILEEQRSLGNDDLQVRRFTVSERVVY